jgi:hypothetical protein
VTDLASRRATPHRRPDPGSEPSELRDPPDLADPPDLPDPPPTDQPAPSSGVELTRLLALARLTPAQALEVAAGVLGGAEPGTGRTPVVGADGRVLPGAAARGSRDGTPPATGPAGPDVAAVLAALARAARQAARPADPVDDELLTVLDRAVAELPVAGVPVVARMLEEAAGAVDRGVVRAELAALVRAVDGVAGASRGTAPAGTGSAAVRAAPAGRATRGTGRTAGRRIGAWLLTALVLAGVLLLEIVLLRDKIATDVGLLLDAGRSGSTSSGAPAPDGLPIVLPAPAAAGSVAGVDLRPLGACTPGAPCSLRLLVRLVPGADPQVVTWSYRVVDRCTGATGTAPGGSVTVPAGGERAAVLGTVPLPAGRAVAVVAVTDLPAAAASSPVLVGSCLPGPRPE